MKIYLASSWKNSTIVIMIAKMLRESGHEVDCFCEETDKRFSFNLLDIIEDIYTVDSISFLKLEEAKQAFFEDKKWLDWCDVCIMILPCGKSAHLEAGYAKGQGKKLYIIGDIQKGDFDVMYGFADGIYRFQEIGSLIQLLSMPDIDKIMEDRMHA